MNIVHSATDFNYLVHNLNDPAVERRCRMFEAGGARVKVAGFCRDETLRPDIAARSPLMLGRSSDAAFASRAAATLRRAAMPGELAAYFAGSGPIVARNLEQLAIARRITGSRPLIYECLDIHRSLTGTSLPSRMVQAVERALLPRVDLLLTSSPAFLTNHFDRTNLAAPGYLIENKLLALGDAPRAARRVPGDSGQITIGWFGMLRCARTFDVLRGLCEEGDGRVRVRVLISGKPSPAELPDFEKRVARVQHMEFTGAYTYDDLPGLYAQCDFAWTIDWFEEGANSAWLLPNRLYEALIFGAVPIALAGIEVGRWLARHSAGLLVGDPDRAAETVLAVTPQDIFAMRAKVAAIDPAHLIADVRDCERLVAAIAGARQ